MKAALAKLEFISPSSAFIFIRIYAHALDKPAVQKPVAAIGTLYLQIDKTDTPHELIAAHFH